MAKTQAEHSKAYRERQKAKRLAAGAVARSDKGREKAEAAQGRQGPARPGGGDEPRAKTVGEAIARVKNEQAVATAVEAPAREFRAPTRAEIEMVRQFAEMATKPLTEFENDFAAMGIIGPEVPPALAKTGCLAASKEELDSLSLCTAGTMVNFTPSFMTYLYPIGLMLGMTGFVGSRLLVFFRINNAMKAIEKKQQEENEARRRGGVNGAPSPSASQASQPGRN